MPLGHTAPHEATLRRLPTDAHFGFRILIATPAVHESMPLSPPIDASHDDDKGKPRG